MAPTHARPIPGQDMLVPHQSMVFPTNAIRLSSRAVQELSHAFIDLSDNLDCIILRPVSNDSKIRDSMNLSTLMNPLYYSTAQQSMIDVPSESLTFQTDLV